MNGGGPHVRQRPYFTAGIQNQIREHISRQDNAIGKPTGSLLTAQPSGREYVGPMRSLEERSSPGPVYTSPAAAYGSPAAGQQREGKRDSAVQRLKRRVRSMEETCEQLQNESAHWKERVQRVEEGHRLEVGRLKKEIMYHTRLRLGADQRAFELEERLLRERRQTQTFDEAQSSLIEQSQLLVSKNAELAYKIKNVRAGDA